MSNGCCRITTRNKKQSCLMKYFTCIIFFSLFLIASYTVDASSKDARAALQTTLEEIMAILQSEEFKASDKNGTPKCHVMCTRIQV